MKRVFILAILMTIAIAAIAREATVEGNWLGTLDTGGAKLRMLVSLQKAADGTYIASATSIDEGGARLAFSNVEVDGGSVRLRIDRPAVRFEGSLSPDGSTLRGTWTQARGPLAIEFTRMAVPDNPRPLPASAPDSALGPFGLPIEVTVPVHPLPFRSGNRTHLVYELHVTNLSNSELLIQRLEVTDGSAILASLEGTELSSILVRPGTSGFADSRSLGPGLRAIAYLWVTVDAPPERMRLLSHRVTIGNRTFEVAPISLSTAKPIVLGAPLHGPGWIASNGPGNNSVHRRALTPINGTATIAQRFATDWMNRGADSSNTYAGDRNQNRSYYAYGADVLSVADAVVIATQDTIPENTPGAFPAVPITPETIGGNYIVLDLGSGIFATYLHLQPRSLRVKKGDHVVRGQVLALVGNSGNSKEPHLHFQVTDGTGILHSEGLPYVIDSYDVEHGAGNWESRRNELPLQNDKIRLP